MAKMVSRVGWVACCLATQHIGAVNVGLEQHQPNLPDYRETGFYGFIHIYQQFLHRFSLCGTALNGGHFRSKFAFFRRMNGDF
jgi:hypothetical protein